MIKKLFSILFLGIIFISVNLSTGCTSKGPAGPASTPTRVPVVNVTGSITLPAAQTGKTIMVAFYSSLADLGSPNNTFTGTCTSNPMPYSLTVSAGSYYIIAVVDVDNNSMYLSPNAGDYVGVYGVTWPAWPASKNAAVSTTTSAFDLTLVTAVNNISGTITIPSDQTGKEFWVFLDQDTNGGNSNYVCTDVVS